jgi:branched-chain amino acid transport system permease protein
VERVAHGIELAPHVGHLQGQHQVGVAQQLAAGYQDNLAFIGRGLSNVVPYVVLFAILLWRPSGLFGTREITRV